MIVALLLAAAQGALAQGFPCRLDAMPRKPVILLIGENHCDAGSRKVKRDAWRRAAAGELAVGQEGLFPGDEPRFYGETGLRRGPNSLIFGIEQPFSHGLVFSYFAGTSGKVCEVTDDDAAYSSVLEISNNRVLRVAWKLALRSQGGDDLLRRSHAARLLQHGAQGRPVTKEEFQALGAADFNEMLRLLRVMNNFYVKAANDERQSLGLEQPLTPLPIELHNPPLPEEKAQLDAAERSIEAVIVPVRNRMMVANLEQVYCSVAPSGRQVVAVVGANHVPGMRELLRRDSGGAVDVQGVDSEHQPDLALRGLATLAAHGGEQASSTFQPPSSTLAAPSWR